MITLIESYPYDNKYDYIKTFNNKSEQQQYFNTFNYTKFTDDNYIKEHENSFKVPLPYDYMVSKGMNYIIFNNGYKDIFAFIIEKQYVSEEVTRIIYEIDVIQTYMFDFTLKNSYIERKNCSINEVSDFDEGFNIGEHEISTVATTLPKEYEYYAMFNGIKNQELVFENGKLVNVISAPFATNRPLTIIDGIQYPLHFMPLKEEYLEPTFVLIDTGSSSGGNVGGGTVGGDWENGKISSSCFRFIKGMEGFAPNPYQDVSGYWTIAYGVTLHGEPDIYNELVAQAPVSEQVGAILSYDLKNEKYAKPIVERCKELGITKQCQFDALTSLGYNCGIGVILGDNTLTNAIKSNPNDESVIRPIFEKFYITSGGVEYEGLKLRRIQECNMYFGKEVEIRPIPLIDSKGSIIGTMTENNGDGWLPS